jgi:hypothetical protein
MREESENEAAKRIIFKEKGEEGDREMPRPSRTHGCK